MQQLLLFSREAPQPSTRFRAGDIVRQSWPWIGCYDVLYPYWQIRFSTTMRELHLKEVRAKHPTWPEQKLEAKALEECRGYGDPDVVRHYCSAVPYGTYPGEVWWFDDEDLVPTGLSWRIPSWEEIQDWCVKDRKVSEYVASLNAPHRSRKRGECDPSFYPPYSEEKNLVVLLKRLSTPWRGVTRDNFDFFFDGAPAPSSSSSPAAEAPSLALFP